jgi:hypothetical protein
LRTGAPDPVGAAEDTIAGMLDHCAKLGIDAGRLRRLDDSRSDRALVRLWSRPVADHPAGARRKRPGQGVLRDANMRGVEPPSLSTAKLAIANTCRLH